MTPAEEIFAKKFPTLHKLGKVRFPTPAEGAEPAAPAMAVPPPPPPLVVKPGDIIQTPLGPGRAIPTPPEPPLVQEAIMVHAAAYANLGRYPMGTFMRYCEQHSLVPGELSAALARWRALQPKRQA